MRRRLLTIVLFGLLVAGGAAVAWQARAEARLVERDLTAARDLLGRAGGFSAGKLDQRLALVDEAEAHTLAAQRRLGSLSLRLLGALPIAGRDVRVARAVAASATGTVRATAEVVEALQPIQSGPPARTSIVQASESLLGLHQTLEVDLERVRATRPLLAGASRDHYLEAATSASATAERAGQALKLAADLYGPPARPAGSWPSRTRPSSAAPAASSASTGSWSPAVQVRAWSRSSTTRSWTCVPAGAWPSPTTWPTAMDGSRSIAPGRR